MWIEGRQIARFGTLQIKPPPPPILNRGHELHVEVHGMFHHLDPETSRGTGRPVLLTFERRFGMHLHGEDSLPQRLVRVNPQETLAEHNKARNVLDCVWREVVKLNPVYIKKSSEEGVKRQRKTSREVVDEDHTLIFLGARNFLCPWLAPAPRSTGDLALFLQRFEGLHRNTRSPPIPGVLPRACRTRRQGRSLACGTASLLWRHWCSGRKR